MNFEFLLIFKVSAVINIKIYFTCPIPPGFTICIALYVANLMTRVDTEITLFSLTSDYVIFSYLTISQDVKIYEPLKISCIKA